MDNLFSLLVQPASGDGDFQPTPLFNVVRLAIHRFLFHINQSLRPSFTKVFLSGRDAGDTNYDLLVCGTTLKFILRGTPDAFIAIEYLRPSVASTFDIVYRFLLLHFPDEMEDQREHWVFDLGKLYIFRCLPAIHSGLIFASDARIPGSIPVKSTRAKSVVKLKNAFGLSPSSTNEGYAFSYISSADTFYVVTIASLGQTFDSHYTSWLSCYSKSLSYVLTLERQIEEKREKEKRELEESKMEADRCAKEEMEKSLLEAQIAAAFNDVQEYANFNVGKISGTDSYELNITFSASGILKHSNTEFVNYYDVPGKGKLVFPSSKHMAGKEIKKYIHGVLMTVYTAQVKIFPPFVSPYWDVGVPRIKRTKREPVLDKRYGPRKYNYSGISFILTAFAFFIGHGHWDKRLVFIDDKHGTILGGKRNIAPD